jgi:flagellar biosynthetic protein FlhB
VRHLTFNLQLFGEKTEKASGKKRSDARKKGQVIFSKDANMAVVFLAAMIALNSLGGYIINQFTKSYLFYTNFQTGIDDLFNPSDMSRILGRVIIDIMSISGPVVLVAMVVGVLLNYLQVGFLLTGETIKFKLDKLNPVNGLKQMFSIRSLVELAKNLLKIAILTAVSYSYLKDKMGLMIEIMNFDAVKIGAIMWEMIFNLSLRISLILIIIGVADYGYKIWQNEKDLKMSKQEVKEEYKQLEGNPQIKSKIREKQRQMAMSRMMQDVPKADVIITNPTHFAVAVKYDASKYDAPYVVAKGQDLIAKKIRKVAEENKVPIVENKPLARELYATVKVGNGIPEHLYHAVAEVLAFVYKIKK